MALAGTNFIFPGQTSFYKGKVRDVYDVQGFFIAIASDRISAFDHVLPKPIPHKGQVLNQIAAHFLVESKSIVPNWLITSPHPNVTIGRRCQPFLIEMVIRGYLAGHAWREYKAGKRTICGVRMPEGMKEGDAFPHPIITPATKAQEGHDEDISREDIIERNLVSRRHLDILEDYTYKLYELGSQMAVERGLLLVDTKYEFGLFNDEIYLIDEIHTPDSSRYYYAEGYEQRQKDQIPQEQLSKEFVREWLMNNGFQGKEGQVMPEMPDSFIGEISSKYIHLYQVLTGKTFEPCSYENLQEDIYQSVQSFLNQSSAASSQRD